MESVPAIAAKKITVRIVPWLIICLTMAYIDRTNLAFAQFSLAKSFGIDPLVFGTAAGVFFAGYIAAEIPSNLLLLRFGARRWLARIMISWGVVTMSTYFVHTDTQLYIVRFLLGVCEAGFYPGVLFYLTRFIPIENRAKTNFLFISAIPLSAVIGSIFSGWLLETISKSHYLGMAAWQWLFLTEGLMTIFIGIALLFVLPESIKSVKYLTDTEKLQLSAHIRTQEETKAVIGSPLKALLDLKVWIYAIVTSASAFSMYCISFWLPQIIKSFNVTNTLHIGFINAIPWGLALVALGASFLMIGTIKRPVFFLSLLYGIGCLSLSAILLNGISVTTKLGLISVATTAIMLTYPVFWSLVNFLKGKAAAVIFAVINSIGSLAGFMSPIMMGYVIKATGSPQLGIVIMSGFMGLAVVLLFVIHIAFAENQRAAAF
ncbi:MFS transporter [Chromobacterium violaceum]|uniref:MFS transporter n=1 Tax=Chromobacterium violaceum TaxID=536 RepID=UPI001BECFBBE|nr:MFS transporter [Chromobacterium violaceum]MBT2868839.1 MFS transporter [Chromobacterium violaceum]